jgi:hypothetical protein
MSSEAINFDGLVQVIQQTHSSFASQASKAVNISLTLRNWFIGHHIAEFELHGADRAGYGDGLLDALSRALRSRQVSNTGRRQLYGYLRFYRSYPQIVRTASALLPGLRAPGLPSSIVRTASAQTGVPATLEPARLLSSLTAGLRYEF